MKIIRSAHLGMCFGVRDAIAMAQKEASAGPLTIVGDLVHNESVLSDLRQRGIRIAQQVSEISTTKAMITAHGASDRAINGLKARGLEVVEATCPLVHFAHRAVSRLANEGFYPVIVGQRNHVEVRGLTEDLDAFDVVLTEADVKGLVERPRFGVASQTTQPIERVRHLVAVLRQRFPQAEVRFVDTVCQPTKQRQFAAEQLASQCDVVVVVGGAHSNNTRELVETCRGICSQVHHVQGAGDVCAEWFDGVEMAGLTAGTSTPDWIIDEVETKMRALAANAVEWAAAS